MILPVSIVMFMDNVGPEGLSLWMQKRVENGPLNGLMEFPGGKIEAGESSEQAGRREVFEEVGINVKGKLPLFKRHSYELKGKTILLHVHFSNFKDIPAGKGEWFSFKYSEGSNYLRDKIPEVNHNFIDLFLKYMKDQFGTQVMEQL